MELYSQVNDVYDQRLKISIFTPYDKNLSFFSAIHRSAFVARVSKGEGRIRDSEVGDFPFHLREFRLRLPVSLVLKPRQGGMDFVNLAKDIISATREPCSPCSTCTRMRHSLGIASSAEVKTPAHRLETAETLETLS